MASLEKILVLGSGGREHAICWHLKRNNYDVVCSPGSDAISKIVSTIPLQSFDQTADFMKQNGIRDMIVGPEKYLAEGVADHLTKRGLSVFGPTESASRLETDKGWAKEFCFRHKIPTAHSETITDPALLKESLMRFRPPFVIKASGLAQGKGVWIGSDWEDALKFGEIALREHRAVVVEEFLNGEEISYFILIDQDSHVFLGAAQDHKRLLENDRGPNTGGMGAYSPVPTLTPDLQERIELQVVKPIMEGLARDQIAYRGFLFLGLMISNGNPYLLEFNCRLGDPETQSLMMRLETPLPQIIKSLSNKRPQPVKLKDGVSLNVVVAARGYPHQPESGFSLPNIDQTPAEIQIFHSGTKWQNSEWIATGGRLFSVNTFQKTLLDCQQSIYPWIENLAFQEKITYRRDIGVKAYRHLIETNDYA